ncbi:hypothetical protein KCP76_04885 [Salmonella enterica subsp. enterica serovar Weltevreden]|nr:hypothetical protein KCP76_04885 [Salmonella enterica subsp. enterica serovar Weltevreden]
MAAKFGTVGRILPRAHGRAPAGGARCIENGGRLQPKVLAEYHANATRAWKTGRAGGAVGENARGENRARVYDTGDTYALEMVLCRFRRAKRALVKNCWRNGLAEMVEQLALGVSADKCTLPPLKAMPAKVKRWYCLHD